ncbi:adenosine receptor A1-like [Apostichopus japonicus]|uniref:adenosine receptor A1-like n=1 Tax=Stichopus japonicus TaxID=307972 RepID=UPI003AB285DE
MATIPPTENDIISDYGNSSAPYDAGNFITVLSVSVQILLIIVIFCGNFLVTALVCKFERLHTPSNFFVANMAIGDIIVSLGMMPGVVITFNPYLLANRYFCLLLWCTQLLGSSISCLSLLSLTVDRYLKITRPLRFVTLVTMRRVGIVIASIWAYTFTMTIILPFAGVTQQFQLCFDFTSVFNLIHIQVYLVTCGLITFVIMFICYAVIFKVVLEKSKDMKSTEIAMANAKRRNKEESTSTAEGKGSKNRRPSMIKPWVRRQIKSLKTLVIVIGLTAVAWIPIDVVLFKEIYNPDYRATLTLRTILSWFTYFNSAANPFIYAFRSPEFRVSIRQAVRLFWQADENRGKSTKQPTVDIL